MFERRPFWNCPSCGAESTFGVLFVNGRDYVRKCVNCRHWDRIDLPLLKKTVIYLDQNAISNMAKSLLRKTDGVWLALFRKLHRLVCTQLVVCPDSDLHFVESAVAKLNQPFRRIYHHLASGVSLYDTEIITRFQFQLAFDDFIARRESQSWVFDIEQITRGRVNDWQNFLMVSAKTRLSEADLAAVRAHRDGVWRKISFVFRRWQNETKSFEQYFAEEADSLGPAILKTVDRYYAGILSAVGSGRFPSIDLPPSECHLYSSLKNRLPPGTPGDRYRSAEVDCFLASKSIQNIPIVRISSAIYAALAKQTNDGRKKPPDRGLGNDLKAISAYLPYVDAMFVDNKMRAILDSGDVRRKLAYGTRVFSSSNIDDFVALLDSLQSSATPVHIAKLAEVYGEDWGSTFDSILDEYNS